MKLDIEITPVERFEVKIQGEEIGEFSKESSWNGFMELINKKREVIIVRDNRLSVGSLPNEIYTSDLMPFDVLNITPSLIPSNVPAHVADNEDKS